MPQKERRAWSRRRLHVDAVLDVVADILEHLHAENPFGPLIVRVCPRSSRRRPKASEPAFCQCVTSEYLRQHLAADILFARFGVGQNAAWRRDDGDAEAVATRGSSWLPE
jgi:hypothetical protein